MDDDSTIPYRTRVRGFRRTQVSTMVSPALHEALSREAAEREVSLSTHAADVLAEHAGVPA